jgi:hypothetical protein
LGVRRFVTGGGLSSAMFACMALSSGHTPPPYPHAFRIPPSPHLGAGGQGGEGSLAHHDAISRKNLPLRGVRGWYKE